MIGAVLLLDVSLSGFIGLTTFCVDVEAMMGSSDVNVAAGPVEVPGVPAWPGKGALCSLSNGRSDQPSGMTTPGGRSALPDGIADVFGRKLCLWICG